MTVLITRYILEVDTLLNPPDFNNTEESFAINKYARVDVDTI